MAVFKALWVTEAPHGVYETQVVERDTGDLPAGDVLIRVQYSSLNYKDALSASGNRGVTRKYPHTPGIDAAGVVAESSVAEFAAGDEVIVTGYDLGMNTAGGFGQYIRVPAAWVIKRPQGLSLREAMILGTAGLTAALCVEKLERSGLRPDHGSVLVTGASGGGDILFTAWGPSRSSIAPPWPMASTSRCSRNSGPARWTPSAATSSSTWSSRCSTAAASPAAA